MPNQSALQSILRVGSEFQVNSYTALSQMQPTVTGLPGGGFVITWVSDGQDGSGSGVYGQVYNADGSSSGGEFQVNTYTLNDQWSQVTLALPDGGFVVTWQAYARDGVVYPWGTYHNGQLVTAVSVCGQAFNSDGSPRGSEFIVNSDPFWSGAGQQDIAALNNGKFIIVWNSGGGQDGYGYGVYGHIYNSDGSPQGGEFGVNTATVGDQRFPQVASLENGGFVVTWLSNGNRVCGQAYYDDGSPRGSEFQVGEATAYNSAGLGRNSVTSLSGGGFVVMWHSDGQDGSGYGIYGQVYDGDGVSQGENFRVNTYIDDQQRYPEVSSLADGGFVVVWRSNNQDGSWDGVYGQVYNGDGSIRGNELSINSYTLGDQTGPTVEGLSNGGFVVTWNSVGQDGDSGGIYGQTYYSDGTPQGEEFLINTYMVNDQSSPSVSSLTDGSFVTVWQSQMQDGSDSGIYGQRYFPNIPATGSVTITNATTDVPVGPQAQEVILFDGNKIVFFHNTNEPSLVGPYDASPDPSGDIYGQKYDANGALIGSPFLVNTTTFHTQYHPTAIQFGDGSFVVVWSQSQYGASFAAAYQRFAADGTPVGSETLLQTSDDPINTIQLTGLLDGSFTILAGRTNETFQVAASGAAPFEDQVLTADISGVTDADGIDAATLTYQWLRDGTAINGATDGTYTLTQADVGAAIAVRFSYTDNYGTYESVTSAATAAVENVNDDPLKKFVVDGFAIKFVDAESPEANGASIEFVTGGSATFYAPEDQSVSFSYFLDGYTDVLYSFSPDITAVDFDGSDYSISGATYGFLSELEFSDGEPITVFALSWEGRQANTGFDRLFFILEEDVEQVLSQQQFDALFANYLPTEQRVNVGEIASDGTTILLRDLIGFTELSPLLVAGEATQHQVLTADISDIFDADGIDASTIAYQWLRDGTAITGATEGSYTLTQADVDAEISVQFSYTDNYGAEESVTSAATAAVENVNDGPIGLPTINGSKAVGQILVASSAGITDEDGLGPMAYQWLRDGVAISGATASSYGLVATDFGHRISVEISYEDGFGEAESVMSAETVQISASHIGTNLANTLTGTTSSDVMSGLAGNDKLYGLQGDDYLDGGAGSDSLFGDAGNDTYIVDNSRDLISEKSGQGTDTVVVSLAAYILGLNLENLTYSGAATFSGKGNTLANTLTGGIANDSLDGATGADTLIGRAGNDTYTVDNAGDRVVEAVGDGSDLVLSSVTIATLFDHVEKLTLTGLGSISGTGNGLSNVLTGNSSKNSLFGLGGEDSLVGGAGNDSLYGGSGSDTLVGGFGSDILAGGADADVFVFNATPSTQANKDAITDFNHFEDEIWLAKSVMTGLGVTVGALSADAFWSGANVNTSHDATDRVIYNTTTGALYYDADGSGRIGAVQIAELTAGAVVTSSDFFIF